MVTVLLLIFLRYNSYNCLKVIILYLQITISVPPQSSQAHITQFYSAYFYFYLYFIFLFYTVLFSIFKVSSHQELSNTFTYLQSTQDPHLLVFIFHFPTYFTQHDTLQFHSIYCIFQNISFLIRYEYSIVQIYHSFLYIHLLLVSWVVYRPLF